MDMLNCFIDDQASDLAHSGRYLVLNNLSGKEIIRLEFPVTEEIDQYTMYGTEYTVAFRGAGCHAQSAPFRGRAYPATSLKGSRGKSKTFERKGITKDG